MFQPTMEDAALDVRGATDLGNVKSEGGSSTRVYAMSMVFTIDVTGQGVEFDVAGRHEDQGESKVVERVSQPASAVSTMSVLFAIK